MMWDDGKRVRGGIHALGRRTDEPHFAQGGVRFPPERFFGAGSVNPETPGMVVFHDGTDEDVPAGLYRSDPANSQWVKVSDNSVTFQD